jgi:hypothetical protein
MGFASDRHIKLINVTHFFVCIQTQINKKINMANDVLKKEKKLYIQHTLVPRIQIFSKNLVTTPNC